MVRRLIRVLQWRRLKDAHLVLVRSGDLTRVRTAVQGRDADIVVHCSGDDLHPLEVASQYHDVASCGVCLKGMERDFGYMSVSSQLLILSIYLFIHWRAYRNQLGNRFGDALTETRVVYLLLCEAL